MEPRRHRRGDDRETARCAAIRAASMEPRRHRRGDNSNI